MQNDKELLKELAEKLPKFQSHVMKRNGTEVDFDAYKIAIAISKANREMESEDDFMSEFEIISVTEKVLKELKNMHHIPNIEEIQDIVIYKLMESNHAVAKAYAEYRFKKMLIRTGTNLDGIMLSIVDNKNEEVNQENSNKDVTILSVQRDYLAGEVSRDISNRIIFDEDVIKAHMAGSIHNHDTDYTIHHMHNCDLINLEDIFQNGTMISGVYIDPPKSFDTGTKTGTQVVAQVASSQYGGQTFSLAHFAPLVDMSRKKWKERLELILSLLNPDDVFTPEAVEALLKAGLTKLKQILSEKFVDNLAEKLLMYEIKAGIQTIQYQLNTFMTTNGQTPFVSMNMDINEVPEGQTRDDLALLIKEVFEQRMLGLKNEKGVFVPAAFPKLLYVLDENNIHEDSKYWYLTKLAAKCSAKTMVPDYISAKKMRELKGDVYPCMGCRSFLTPDRFTDAGVGNIANAKNYTEGRHKYYGRFNQGVVTINLVDVACSSHKNIDQFWKIFDERLELCHRALQTKHKRLLGTPSDVAPILWQHGALARLEKGEPIDKLLFNGYSTISLGYAGLYEMTYYMTGHSHTDPEGKPFAIQVMKHMNDMCAKWKAEENIDYSLYGTPIESTTYKFAKALQRRFGIIENVTDHGYITNSYHVNVREEIDAFTKLDFEAEFQELSPGGCISYVEVPDLNDNIDVVIEIIKHIYDNIMYAEINTKSDYCQCCGYDGEIKIVDDDQGKHIWKCPNCGNTDMKKMNIIRRTCGYLGTQGWNQGRTEEIKDRVMHVGLEDIK